MKKRRLIGHAVQGLSIMQRKFCQIIVGLALLLLMIHVFILYCKLFEEGDEVSVPGWEGNKSRNALDYIRQEAVTTIVTNSQICDPDSPPYVMLIVCSRIENFDLRLTIRNTWAFAAYQRLNVSVAFIVGLSTEKQLNDNIKKESNLFGDIIVEDFLDTYNNLTLKSIMLLKWVQRNCQNAKYVMKADDDAYINLRSLMMLLDNIPEFWQKNLLIGKLMCGAKPILDPTNKWYTPKYMYEKEVYPHYLSGISYLMSASVAERLYEQSFKHQILHMEDVFITGICAEGADIKPVGHKAFLHDDEAKPSCSIDQLFLVAHSHKLTPYSMLVVHKELSICKVKDYLPKLFKNGFLSCAKKYFKLFFLNF